MLRKARSSCEKTRRLQLHHIAPLLELVPGVVWNRWPDGTVEGELTKISDLGAETASLSSVAQRRRHQPYWQNHTGVELWRASVAVALAVF